MASAIGPEEEISDLAAHIGHLAVRHGVDIVVAESLTAGRVSQALGAAPEAGAWFAGGVVAYKSETKFAVLNVDPGPVITAKCAEQMAQGAREATGADVSVAVTGVGGPGAEEGHPAGTVFIAVSSASVQRTFNYLFDGSPTDVVELTTVHALRNLKGLLLDMRSLEEIS